MKSTATQEIRNKVIRNKAELIAEKLEAARAATNEAKEIAVELYTGIEQQSDALPRFSYQVLAHARCLANDLGAEVDGKLGDHDIDQVIVDANDLIDLIDLASNRKELTHV